MISTASPHNRIVITGIGLTSPNGNSLAEYREALLSGRSGVRKYDIRYVGATLAGVCDFDELKYQKRRDLRRGTRAGSIGIYCAQEAVADSGLDWPNNVASASIIASVSGLSPTGGHRRCEYHAPRCFAMPRGTGWSSPYAMVSPRNPP